jgi:DNA helicase HerA-like ATPase
MSNPSDVLMFADGPDTAAGIVLKRINRHGLVTGATGTGKTVTLQTLAENMARAGIPVFVTDVKGDLSGIALPKAPGSICPPCVFWDLAGKNGHAVRITVSEFGPILMGELLDLSPVQRGVLELCFKVADDSGLLLLDFKDLRAMLQHLADNAKEISASHGLVSTASVAAIQRSLLSLENEGADQFFGEPALELHDIMRVTPDGKGQINVLHAAELMQKPKLYGCFLLWLLAELFEQMPEAGDLPVPKLAVFFDEAHLMFDNAPKALLEKVGQVMRLIRSKGIGVYYVTQNPADIPEDIQGQLGNRIQHALRAFTPQEQKKVKAAADSLRPNPAFDTYEVIGTLGVGEALVSLMDVAGAPTVVERVKVRLPESRLGPLQAFERQQLMITSAVAGKYDITQDRHSAYEALQSQKAAAQKQTAPTRKPWEQTPTDTGRMPAPEKMRAPAPPKTKPAGKPGRPKDTFVDTIVKTTVRSVSSTIGRQIGQQILRGLMGSMRKK